MKLLKILNEIEKEQAVRRWRKKPNKELNEENKTSQEKKGCRAERMLKKESNKKLNETKKLLRYQRKKSSKKLNEENDTNQRKNYQRTYTKERINWEWLY